jgi:hypothetical protein
MVADGMAGKSGMAGMTGGMAQVRVENEQETPRGWRYHVVVERDGGSSSEHEVALAWVDHEHWCGGRVAPSMVVERLFGVLLERGDQIPARFDAATARRWFRELDGELMRRL